eukprot:m51a1_g7550 putative adenylate guanylate cyclase with integral membrane sensor (743) ;mRNA; f:86555-88854
MRVAPANTIYQQSERMKVSFRALLVVTVCAAVWIPMIVVVLLFNARSQELLRRSTEERLPPTVVRLGGTVEQSLVSAESVGVHTALDISTGLLEFDESEEGQRRLRVRWDNILRAFHSASSTEFMTGEGNEYPARLIGIGEFGNGVNVWWWTYRNTSFEQWQMNKTNLVPFERQWIENDFSYPYLDQVRSAIPAGEEECWMPIYFVNMWTWATYVKKAYVPNTEGPNRPVWAYTIVDLVIQDIANVFAGLTVSQGVAVLVDSPSSTLLGTTSQTIQCYHTVGTDMLPVLVNETEGDTPDHYRVAAVNDLVERKYGNWDALTLTLNDKYDAPSTPEIIMIKGVKNLVSFTRVRRPCLSWVVAVVSEFDSAPVDLVPIIVAVCTTVVALVVLGILSLLLTRPLSKLSQRMELVSRLKFNRGKPDISIFSEFHQLNKSFKKLSTGIEAMTKFVPMPVISQIMMSSMTAAGLSQEDLLAVSMKRVTIMFCDIKGFTTMSEKLKTNTVVQMLFKWLGAFTKVIVKNDGIVDKYIGDCIMALWNAPLDIDQPEAKACASALEFSEVLKTLNEKFVKDGHPEMSVRVGIHSGELYVGNIGCEDHVNYTVCGTPANTASRLEQLGKVYGVTPLVSGDIATCVSNQYVCVWLDDTKLQGHVNTVTKVYHLAARISDATPNQLYAAEKMRIVDMLFNSADDRASTAELRQLLEDLLIDTRMQGYHNVLALLNDRMGKPVSTQATVSNLHICL